MQHIGQPCEPGNYPAVLFPLMVITTWCWRQTPVIVKLKVRRWQATNSTLLRKLKRIYNEENLSVKSRKYEGLLLQLQSLSSHDSIHIYVKHEYTGQEHFQQDKSENVSIGCQNELHIWIPAEERTCKIPINHFWSVLHEGPSQDPTALSSLFQWHLIWVTGACAEFIPYTDCLIIKDLHLLIYITLYLHLHCL